jgi:hypothetical protein
MIKTRHAGSRLLLSGLAFAVLTVAALMWGGCAAPTPTPPPPTPLPTTGQAKGVLVDGEVGEGIEGLEVMLWEGKQTEYGPGFSIPSDPPTARSGAEGAFFFEDLAPGYYVAVCDLGCPKGLIPLTDGKGEMLLFEVVAGETTDLGRIDIG